MDFMKHKTAYTPLEKRTFRYKNPHMEFFCPLCGTKRAMSTSPHLTLKNYLQISLITMALTAIFYPFMELKGIFFFFVVWALFEGSLRLNFRKEVPCPHCGFDASWYKKDVKIARQKVDEFWHAGKKPEQVEASVEEDEDFSYQPPASGDDDFSEERLSEI
ncbi:MAG: hypothetical protein CME69_05005 [Halobacteriovorax sp.]|nr:hypothetical protein [Halobacteriovorax sp.]|tara:strand:+ start:567 stop:1049 length:483 start_codon:yes stop_codon:yes gene_type:complete